MIHCRRLVYVPAVSASTVCGARASHVVWHSGDDYPADGRTVLFTDGTRGEPVCASCAARIGATTQASRAQAWDWADASEVLA